MGWDILSDQAAKERTSSRMDWRFLWGNTGGAWKNSNTLWDGGILHMRAGARTDKPINSPIYRLTECLSFLVVGFDKKFSFGGLLIMGGGNFKGFGWEKA